jgi:hypothetical protein
VRQLSYSCSLTDRIAHSWKLSEKLNVIEQGGAETLGGLSLVFGKMADDFS